MKSFEQTLYQQTVKSLVTNFEEFVNKLANEEDTVGDADLINSLKRIHNQLELVIIKYDSRPVTLNMINGIGTDVLQALSKNPNYDDFRNLIRDGELNSSECVSSTNFQANASGSGSTLSSQTKLSQDASSMLKLQNIDEKLILGPSGFLVEETSTGFWKCKVCSAFNIPIVNMISHVNGKNHKKKCGVKLS